MKTIFMFLFMVISFDTIGGTFDKQIKVFETAFKIKVTTKIKLVDKIDKPHEMAGAVCSPFHKEIIVLKKWWNYANEAQKEQTIIHELGHCEMRLNHDDRVAKTGCKVSIMHSVLFGKFIETKCYKDNKQIYFNQMKELKKK